jgi:hypothetical protein
MSNSQYFGQETFFNEKINAYAGISGDLTGNVIGNLTGDITGNVIGNLTGDITGDILGNVTGNITSSGISTFQDIRIIGKYFDGSNTFGSSGQILSSDGTKTAWINASAANVGSATSIGINLDSTNASRYLTFVDATSGNNLVKVDADLTYNPSTNALTAGSFVKSGGTSSQFLKADGSVDSTTYSTQTFPSGTLMLFQQTAAPTGWTKQTTHNDKTLRVVSGAAGSGGSTAFTSVFASRTPTGSVSVSGSNSGGSIANTTVTGSVSGSNSGGGVSNTTLSTSEMPSHGHTINEISIDAPGPCGATQFTGGYSCTRVSTAAAGGSGAHGHGFTNPSWSGSVSMNAHSHTFTNPSWSGSASFSGASMDFAVQYVDLIIASRN